MEIQEFANRCRANADRENSTRNDKREVVDTVESDVAG